MGMQTWMEVLSVPREHSLLSVGQDPLGRAAAWAFVRPVDFNVVA